MKAGWTKPQLLGLFAAAGLTPRTALRETNRLPPNWVSSTRVCNLAAGRPLKAWKKSEAVKVRAWKIAGNLAQVTGEEAADAANASPDIVDVRPFVEIGQQLRALHSSPA